MCCTSTNRGTWIVIIVPYLEHHCVMQVLTDNIEACRQLPGFIVRRIFSLAMRDDNTEYTEYITTLVAWMKVQTCLLTWE